MKKRSLQIGTLIAVLLLLVGGGIFLFRRLHTL